VTQLLPYAKIIDHTTRKTIEFLKTQLEAVSCDFCIKTASDINSMTIRDCIQFVACELCERALLKSYGTLVTFVETHLTVSAGIA
jgi:hypothetical protein